MVDWRKIFGPSPREFFRGEKRAITDLPWRQSTAFNLMPPVDYDVTPARALALGPVYAAIRVLADTISTLPLKAYREVNDDERVRAPLPELFRNLRSDGRLTPWLYQLVTSLCTRGNAYGWIVSRDGFGSPTVVEWLDPSRVAPDQRPDKTGWLVDGREVLRTEILHIPWFVLPGQRLGLSPIGAFASTLGVGLNAQQYASDWFGAGGFPPGTFKNNQQTITPDQASEIKARLGIAIRTREPLVYGTDWDYNAVSVPPEEAQFVETMKMTANQIAPIYGVEPEDIGGTAGGSLTYANVEQKAINRVMFGFRPWLVRIENALSAQMWDASYVKFNADALIRADLMTRWKVNDLRVKGGFANVDEIRVQEDQAPLPNGQGQKYLTPQTTSEPAAEPDDDDAPARPLRRVQ